MIAIGFASLAVADEVVVWHAYEAGGAEEAALSEVRRRFEADHPDTTIRLVAVPFGAFDSKVETAIPRNNGPDVFLAGHGSVRKWQGMGLLAPWPEALDGHDPRAVEVFELDGAVWAAPMAYKSLLLFYDPTRIDAPPATTDALIAMARAETGDGRFGLAYQAAEAFYFAPWMHGFGARAIAEDGSVDLDGPAQIEAYRFTRRLAVDEGIAPMQPTYELVKRLYADGQATFVINGPWFLGGLDRPIAAAPLPIVSETGEPARPYLTVDGAYLAANAGNPERAVAFTAFLTGDDGARIRQDVGKQAVTRTAVTTDDPIVSALRAQSEIAIPIPTHPDVSAVWEAQARALRRVIRGAASPEAAAAEAQAMFEAFSRPAPKAANPTPYLAAVGAMLLGLVGSLVLRLRDPGLRARLAASRADYLWVAPAGIALLALVVVPFVVGAAVSLFAHHAGEWTFVGLAHFRDILLARDFPITSPLSFLFTLGVTVLWTVTNLTLHVSIGVAMALLLREPWIRLRSVWRALLILPWAVPNYITALIWKSLFHAQYGAINDLLSFVTPGSDPVQIDWFGRFSTAFAANLCTNTWLGFPFMMVVTLGALQSIPRELEEAAEIDGAGYFTRLRHVIWPLLRPALLPAIILGSVWTFNMFNVVYLVSAGEPDGSTEILISEAYRWAFTRGNRYGYAAAYAVIIFGVLVLYSRAANRVAGRKVL